MTAAPITTLTKLQQQAAEPLLELIGPLRLRSCPLQPTPRQEAFLRLQQLEVLFGGAAGGGKSIALLTAALQYCDVPAYHALLLRPSLTEFELPGGLIEIAHDWLANSKASWSGETRTWRFPGPGKNGGGGASLRFGYLDALKDVSRYAGSSFSFVGFDELVRFDQRHYQRMFRVLRQPNAAGATSESARDGTRLADVPIRARATSNPGGPGHGWVKSYFVDPDSRHEGAVFLPARLTDNPYLNHDDYITSLSVLPRSERERLLNGDWDIPDEGELFQHGWFEQIDRNQLPNTTRAVRFWDLAATEPSAASPDPDYTVGLKLELNAAGTYYITDIVRVRKPPGTIEEIVAATARNDGREVEITIEQEPGAAGRAVTDRYKRHVLAGYIVRSQRATGAKNVRADGAAAAAENGLIKIVRGRNSDDLLDELCAFPHAPHDDCVDALSGAHEALNRRLGTIRSFLPRGNIYDIAERNPSRRRHTGTSLDPSRQLLQKHDAQLAAALNLPLYDPHQIRY
ncbi:MAG TPA: phage terminase large subunit [Gaiellaceae bacterium]|jgi:predicted phage terminase large subunit-like protein